MRCLNALRAAGPHDRHKNPFKRIKSGGVFAGGLDVAADPFGVGGGITGKALDPLGVEGDTSKKLTDVLSPPKDPLAPNPEEAPTPLSPQEETDTDSAAAAEAEAAKKRRGRGAAGTVLTSPLGVASGARIERKSLLG